MIQYDRRIIENKKKCLEERLLKNKKNNIIKSKQLIPPALKRLSFLFLSIVVFVVIVLHLGT